MEHPLEKGNSDPRSYPDRAAVTDNHDQQQPLDQQQQQQQQQPVLHNSLMQSSYEMGSVSSSGACSPGLEFSAPPKIVDGEASHTGSGGPTTPTAINATTGHERPSKMIPNEEFKNFLLQRLDSHKNNNHHHHHHHSNTKSQEDQTELLQSLSSNNLKSVKSHAQLAKTAQGVRTLAKNLSKATIKLQLRSVMIVTKARDNSLIYLTRELAEWLISGNRIDVYVDYHLEDSKRFNALGLKQEYPSAFGRLKYWTKDLVRKNPEIFDLVLTLGGDGTVLYVSTLFQRVVPPVMSFSLGSLGFLTNFKFEDFRLLLEQVLKRGVKTNLRMRFTCRVHKLNGTLVCEQQVLNEIVIDRGPSPWVSMLELYGDGSLLTVAQADGLILATPTGSTAYSLSAGGSLVHPEVSAVSVTPICPHTLSFRPILLPDSMTLTVKVPMRSRSNAWCSFDGRSRIELQKGDYVNVVASPFPFPTVRSSKTEFIDSVSRILNWNVREEQKSFVHLLSDKNRKLFVKHNNEKLHDTPLRNRRSQFDGSLGDSPLNYELSDDDDSDDIDGSMCEEDETCSTNSLDYHQAYFEDNENYNCQEGEEQNDEADFDIDYSESESENNSPEIKQTKAYNAPNHNSDSTVEIDDTLDYFPGNNYKPLPEDEIPTPKYETEMSLLDQINARNKMEKNKQNAEQLFQHLNRLNFDGSKKTSSN